MTEEETQPETTEEEEEEKPQEDGGETPSDNKALSVLEKADNLKNRLEDLNKQLDEKVKKMEELAAHEALGGRSVIGAGRKKELTPEELANKVLEGEFNPLQV